MAIERNPDSLPPMMADLGRILGAAVPSERLGPTLQELVASKSSTDLPWEMAAASGFGDALKSRDVGPKDRPPLMALADGGSPESRDALQNLFKRSSELAVDNHQPLTLRLPAISLLGQAEYSTAGKPLEQLVEPQQPAEIQTAAIRALGQFANTNVATALVNRNRWNSYTPAVRDIVLSLLMPNTNSLHTLFDAVQTGDVAAYTVNADRRNQLMKHKDPSIQQRANALFKDLTPGDRMKVYEETRSVLTLTADPKNGHAVFQKNCTPCHTFAGEGHIVGPDLTGIRNQPSEVILLHIVVPEYEIMPIYTCYSVETKDGQSYTGILAGETPGAITLRMAQGVEQPIPRANIASMQTSRLSLMPQELEKAMTKQEMADLIGFLKGQ
jgi:putative heme-binding domain-containing protein